jgi:hypothetical protein
VKCGLIPLETLQEAFKRHSPSAGAAKLPAPSARAHAGTRP